MRTTKKQIFTTATALASTGDNARGNSFTNLAIELTRHGIDEQTFERALRGAASEFTVQSKFGISPAELEQVLRCTRETTREFITEKTGRVF